MYCLKHNKPKSIHILKQKQELRVTVKWSGTLSKFPGHKSMLGEFLQIFYDFGGCLLIFVDFGERPTLDPLSLV